MEPSPQPPAADDSLLNLVPARFQPLSEAEKKLLRAAPTTDLAVCGPPDLKGAAYDASKADADWGPERVIRADLIRWLCVDEVAKKRVDPSGIGVYGAKISGGLNLVAVVLPFRVVLIHCRLTEDANLEDAQVPLLDLEGSWTHAIQADRLNVRSGIFLRNGFQAEGEVRLLGAQIGGDLTCTGGAFSAFTAQTATVKGNFFWQNIVGSAKTTLDLRNAFVGAIVDDENSWPPHGRLFLNGFAYGHFAGGPTDAETRLKWLALQDPFEPQPYRQLAKVLGERGDDDGAVRVLEEMERLRRGQQDRTRRSRVESWILKESIGYGYNPGLAVWELAGLTALGWIIYRRSYLAGSMVPTDKDAYQSFKSPASKGRPPDHYTRFAPLTYSVENSLPLVKLGQGDRWQPDPEPHSRQAPGGNVAYRLGGERPWPRWLGWLRKFLLWLGLASRTEHDPPPSRFARFGTWPRFLRWFLWFQILLGWLLATLFLAGITGIVRKP